MPVVLNAWGEPVDQSAPSKVYYVAEEERLDTDEGPGSNALDDETGDDLDGWKPGDPV